MTRWRNARSKARAYVRLADARPKAGAYVRLADARSQARAYVRVVWLAVFSLAAGCSSGGVTEPTPPPVTNSPPAITLLVTNQDHVEAGAEVDVTATVTDAETPVDQLQFAWSATPANGTFTGTGAKVRWRAPAGATSPSQFTLKVTVTETYKSGSLQKENVVSTTEKINYNDSPVEIGAVTQLFLTDFGTYSVTPEMCVRNFSDSCRGKADELGDITANRARDGVKIMDATSTIGSIVFNASHTSADVVAPCTFRDRYNDGRVVSVVGNCLLGAVYENYKWLLCYSNFQCLNCNQLLAAQPGIAKALTHAHP